MTVSSEIPCNLKQTDRQSVTSKINETKSKWTKNTTAYPVSVENTGYLPIGTRDFPVWQHCQGRRDRNYQQESHLASRIADHPARQALYIFPCYPTLAIPWNNAFLYQSDPTKTPFLFSYRPKPTGKSPFTSPGNLPRPVQIIPWSRFDRSF